MISTIKNKIINSDLWKRSTNRQISLSISKEALPGESGAQSRAYIDTMMDQEQAPIYDRNTKDRIGKLDFLEDIPHFIVVRAHFDKPYKVYGLDIVLDGNGFIALAGDKPRTPYELNN